MSAGPVEVTGLTQSIAYAQHLAAEAGQHGPDGNESYLARLTAARLAGEAVATGAAMQDAFAAAATAATAHAAELGKQTTVQEQYDVNPDAGDKTYLTGGDTQDKQTRPAAIADDTPQAAAAPAPAPSPRPAQAAADPVDDRNDQHDVPAAPPPGQEPTARINYTIVDTATGNWVTVGCIDAAPALAYADDRTVTGILTQELHRRGELPPGTHVTVSPRTPGQPPMSWVRYAIKDGSRTVGEGSILMNLAKAPAGGDTVLAAAITSRLRSQGTIAHDWHVQVLEKVG